MKISVIIPMYNAKNTISNTIESALSQTYQGSIEIIIINDGSTDGCEKIIEEFIVHNRKNIIIKLINKLNGGVSSARNMGIKESNGKYIAFLDSDDSWHPQKLELQMRIIQEKKLNFLGSTYQYNAFKNNVSSEVLLEKYSFHQLLVKTRFSTPGVIMSKDLFLSLDGFDEAMKYAEDNDLWIRASLVNDLYMVNEPKLVRLYKSAYGEAGLSSNMYAMYQGELHLLKKLLKQKNISVIKYIFINFFVTLKFFRRLVISSLKQGVK